MQPRWILLAGLVGVASGGGCGDDGGFPTDAGIDAPQRGSVQVSWVIKDQTGAVIPCDRVAADTVALELRREGDALGSTESFACKSGSGSTRALQAGNYKVSISLNGARLTSVAAADQRATLPPGGMAQLTPVEFVVDATGTLALSLAIPQSAANCTGTNLSGVTIQLRHYEDGAALACEPATLNRTGGSNTSPYAISCESPPIAACIESTEKLTTSVAIPSGQYQIAVRGLQGAAECWQNNDVFMVQPQGKTTTQALNLAFKDGAPGCTKP